MILQLMAFVVSLFAAAFQVWQQPLQHVKDMSELVGRMPVEKLDLDRLLADIQSALGDCKGADA